MKFFKNSKDGSALACRRRDGFTLIELLVVVAIISLLSSVILASLTSARSKGRDAKRASDVHQLKIALAYYYDANGSYPSVTCDGCGTAISNLTAPLSPYIKQIPDDPLGSTYAWQYVKGDPLPGNPNSYGLWIYYEKTSARCVSGVDVNLNWWGAGVACPF